MNDDYRDAPPISSSYDVPLPAASHVAVMDRQDNYVSLVTSLNTWFGSRVMLDNGVLLNNAMANFFVPGDDNEG